MAALSSPAALRAIAKGFLAELTSATYSRAAVEPYLSASALRITHDSFPSVTSRAAFLDGWDKAPAAMPEFHMELIDAVAEVDSATGAGGKVWIFSKISGAADGERDSMDMMRINEGGLIVESRDVQRIS